MSATEVETEVGVPPAVVDLLHQIHEDTGMLTAERVVEAARPKASPAHAYFEWNDGLAAQQYRLVQARHLIGRVRLTIIEHPVRAFPFISSIGSYKPVKDAMSSPTYREEILARFLAQAEQFEARWRHHKAVAEAFKEWAKKVAS